jgi:type III secretion apparatus protein, HrpE/YscL family
MAQIFYLKQGAFSLSPGAKVLKAAEYANFVQGEAILAQARAEAAAIVEQAKAHYEAEKARGYEEGLEEGKIEMTMTMLDSLSAGVNYIEGIETTMVELVMGAVSKIMEGFSDEERVIGMVRKSLNYVRSQKRVTLRVSIEEGEMVSARLEDLRAQFSGIDIIDIAPDSRMGRGDCILESEMGVINASLSTQLEGIRRAFSRRLQRTDE